MKRVACALALAAALAGCVSSSERPRATRTASAGGYVVKPGDTLSAIAGRLGVEMTALAAANRLDPPYLIRVGQRLTVPGRGSTAPIRTVSRPVVQPLPPESQRETRPAYSPVPSQSRPVPVTLTGAPRLTWPADGPLVEGFGGGEDPRGIAIAAHKGAAVRAASGGTVIFAGTEPSRYGQMVLVDHGGGWVSAYAHLSRLVVREGETLRSGARVGFVGETGTVKEPRLHFELRRNNQPLDPAPLLPPRF